ncbi:Transcriptional regulatory protein ZraR [bacterium HR15]|nr:Transcriptional regulatory protein ZraR [bacterium HR15]
MKGFRILVVEDEVLLQQVMEDAARLVGLPCEVVRTGQEALERLRQHAYDLLIQDVRLPDISGAAIVQAAHQIDPTMPIILITAYAAEAELQQAVQQGVDAVLFKPFDIDTLLTSMRHLLLKRQATSATHAAVQMPREGVLEAGVHPIPTWLAIPPVGEVVTLHFEGRRLIGRVHAGNELTFAVETPPAPEVLPARLRVELTGRDALYQFSTRLLEHSHRGESDWWLLRRPRQIRRIQRRREPRLPARGRAVISAAGRLLRTTEGELIDLSTHGVALKLPVELNRGTPLRLLIEWQEGEALHRFQSEGVVRHTMALTEAGAPVYLCGVELFHIPRAIRALIRERVRQQLLG